ncbi:MAG: family 78 glycoside hydrolase catalytic domain [Balneolaceae bacterium]|nr:family 78 glycoside hydrolase catalytic domain [Balneolaceae bacterium]
MATKEKELEQNNGDIWNSGKVNSGQNIQVTYRGDSLKSGQRYYWKVRTWDEHGNVSPYSEIGWWETGLLRQSDWKGSWIYNGKPAPDNPEDFYNNEPVALFRKAFALEKEVETARLYISGLGYYEASLNGSKIGDRVLEPGWTNYGKTVQYSVYDVKDLLNDEENVLSVMLGNGWYNPLPLKLFSKFNLREYLTIGRPKLIAQLQIYYRDGSQQTVITDEDWRVGEGPILKNDVFLGEFYDARKELPGWDTPEFDDSGWGMAKLASPPGGELMAQIQAPVKITKTIEPVAITEPESGVYIVDMGQNFAGWIRLRAEGPEGTEINMRYGELLYPDGSLNGLTAVAGQIKEIYNADGGPGAPATAWQQDTFILDGEGEEEFRHHFTFHGFRYVEVKGYPGELQKKDIEGLRLNADLEKNGRFASSNSMFNELQEVTERTFLSNVFSIQSDCPHREKFGYGGDIVTAAEAFLYNYNMGNFYTKTVRDFSRDVRPNGGMPETAPYNGIQAQGFGQGSGPIGWQYAHPFTQMKLYQFYADTSIIREQYPHTRKLVEFLRSNATNHIIDRGISDHEALEEKPVKLTSTAFYYDHARLLSEFARILGKDNDHKRYAELAEEIKSVFIETFLEKGTGRFGPATQTAQAFALFYDLVPPEEEQKAVDVLVDQIMEKHEGHIAAGIFGTKMIFDVLREHNRIDVAYTMANQKTFPGWGYMLENGATTLWEHWAGGDQVYSHNHPMFGSVSEWFYRSLAGINPHPGSAGFKRVVIRPMVPEDLEWANGSYDSIRGTIKSQWKREQDSFHLDVTLPANTSGEIHIPKLDKQRPTVVEGGKTFVDAGNTMSVDIRGIETVRIEQDAIVINAGAGNYRFTLSGN